MEIIEKKLNRDYLFGCIKYNNSYKVYLMPIAYWILNYKKYDPGYNPKEWEFEFRNNVLNVTNESQASFLKAVEVERIDQRQLADLRYISNQLKILYFFIDVDSKLFVSCFPDVEVETYLPDDTWKGIFDNPKSYLPKDISEHFV